MLLGLLLAGDASPRYERLESGLQVVIVEDHALPLASVQLWYRVGAADDPLGSPGLGAVSRAILEHRDDAALRLLAAGVHAESRTLRDACCFSSVLPPDFLDFVLGVEAARLRPLKATSTDVERGLTAAALACADRTADPNHAAMWHLLAALFPEPPYRHPPDFVAASLAGLSADAVNEHLGRWFVPANATLFVIGDVSAVRVLEQVRQHFGGLTWTDPPRRAEPARPADEVVRIARQESAKTGITVAWRTPPLGYFDNAALDVLMHRLCNPIDGPLHRRLTDAGCLPPRAKRHAWRRGGVLVLSIVLRDDAAPATESTLDAIENIVMTEIERAADVLPTEIEHNRARALTRRDWQTAQERFGARARHMAELEIVASDLMLAEFEIPRIRAVGVDDVRLAAVQLGAERRVVMRRGPMFSVASPGVAPLSEPLTRPPAKRPDAQAALRTLAALSDEVPTVQPPRSAAVVSRQQLGGSAELVVCRVPGLSWAEVRTLVSGDSARGDTLNVLLRQGSTQHTAAEIADYVSCHGIHLAVLAGGGRPGLVSRGPARRVPQMIELHAELLRKSRRDGGAASDWRPGEPVEILVVGDVSEQPVIEAARAAWHDARSQPKDGKQPAEAAHRKHHALRAAETVSGLVFAGPSRPDGACEAVVIDLDLAELRQTPGLTAGQSQVVKRLSAVTQLLHLDSASAIADFLAHRGPLP
jgi:zinc protease